MLSHKCLSLFIVLTTLVTTEVFALKRGYGRGGCGIGSILHGRDGEQSSAASTNHSVFQHQISAIWLGTSNCQTDEELVAMIRQEDYLINNYATIAKEIAMGKGPLLAGLTRALGCSEQIQSQVASWLQSHYQQIFAKPGAIAVLEAISDGLSAQPEINHECKYLT